MVANVIPQITMARLFYNLIIKYYLCFFTFRKAAHFYKYIGWDSIMGKLTHPKFSILIDKSYMKLSYVKTDQHHVVK